MNKQSQHITLPQPCQFHEGVMAHPQAPVLLPGEVNMRSSQPSCKFAAPGFAALNPPFSCFYQLKPENFTKAFTSGGRLIGVNQEVAYPFGHRLYHQIPFNWAMDWSHTDVFPCELDSGRCMLEIMSKKKLVEGDAKETHVALQMEPAEYFTAENDEGYKQWVTRKQQEKIAEGKTRPTAKVVPQEIKSLPGHYAPSILETTNETYGRYIDLIPKAPAVYPQIKKIAPTPLKVIVTFRPTNISDQVPIPDHAFAGDPLSFSSRHKALGPPAGERRSGQSFPMYSVTGMELNRPIPQRVSVVSGVGSKEKFRLRVSPFAVPYVYKRHMSYTAPACKQNPIRPSSQ